MKEIGLSGVSQAIHQRNYQRARARALVRLSQIFNDQYKQFLEEERDKDESLGKTWVGISSSTGRPITIESYKDTIEGAIDPADNRENASNYGGEE